MSSGEFDEQLRQALARVEPPDGFTDRVLAKVPRRPQRQQRFLYGTIAAGLAILSTIGVVEHNRNETQRRAQRTESQVVFALTLAADKLAQVNTRLQQSAPELRIDSK